MECKNCENMAESCTVEDLYAKACPYIEEPVLNEHGWMMNPMTEKYQLSDGHIFLIPVKENGKWNIKFIITKNGSGSCGESGQDIYIMAYRRAIDKIEKHDRITEINKIEIKEIFDNKFDMRRSFVLPEKQEEIQVKEYISPFEDLQIGSVGEQLELF